MDGEAELVVLHPRPGDRLRLGRQRAVHLLNYGQEVARWLAQNSFGLCLGVLALGSGALDVHAVAPGIVQLG
uniref:Uncharacterized protein n=1 Tax=Arundo donax TaxID=35708 RepID=A0A0A9ARY7_ARUDO